MHTSILCIYEFKCTDIWFILIHAQAYTCTWDQWTEADLHFCTGNSLSAILDGTAKLTFLKRGEDYLITMPYAHCKGKVWI